MKKFYLLCSFKGHQKILRIRANNILTAKSQAMEHLKVLWWQIIKVYE